MSRSVHTSRKKLKLALSFDYSSEEERIRVLGKIIDERFLKKTMKENARLKKQSQKNGIKPTRFYLENHSVAAKKSVPSPEARLLAKKCTTKKYGYIKQQPNK